MKFMTAILLVSYLASTANGQDHSNSSSQLSAGGNLTLPASLKAKLTAKVTDNGWRNLRFIETNLTKDEYWYVCGSRKVINMTSIGKLDSSEMKILSGKIYDNDLDYTSGSIENLENFLSFYRFTNKDDFIRRMSATCASKPILRMPKPIDAGSSNQRPKTFYYILPREFSAQGNERIFWLRTHYTRTLTYQWTPGSVSEMVMDEGKSGTVHYKWLGKSSPSEVARVAVSCSGSSIRFLSQVKYGSDGGVENSLASPTRAEPIIPETVADAWKEIACLIR